MKSFLEAFESEKQQPSPTRSEDSLNVPVSLLDFIETFVRSEHAPLFINDEMIENLALGIKYRDSLGNQKYGTSLMSRNGRDFSRDFYEEILDAFQYGQGLYVEGKIEQQHVYFAYILAHFMNFLYSKHAQDQFYRKK